MLCCPRHELTIGLSETTTKATCVTVAGGRRGPGPLAEHWHWPHHGLHALLRRTLTGHAAVLLRQ